jgi:bifunctional ADP-heptose synthase (sugar kinase/adenylyltransferase)
MDTRVKIVSLERAHEEVTSYMEGTETVAVVQGWFDVLRSTHVAVIEGAASDSHRVVALVHADSGSRPTVLDEGSRAQLVAALGAVVHVVICDQAAVEELTSIWKPALILAAEEPVSGSVVEDVLQRYRSA